MQDPVQRLQIHVTVREGQRPVAEMQAVDEGSGVDLVAGRLARKIERQRALLAPHVGAAFIVVSEVLVVGPEVAALGRGVAFDELRRGERGAGERGRGQSWTIRGVREKGGQRWCVVTVGEGGERWREPPWGTWLGGGTDRGRDGG